MDHSQIELRSYPRPYRAMLAICSDLDETPDGQVYRQIMRFLNTTDTTAMGPGLGLEVGNTIYFDMPPGQFAYWNTDDAGREMVRALIRSGHIDCLHSYGDLATSRDRAGQALEELVRHDCRLEVWVDHGTAPTNFGDDIMHGNGDQVGHKAYHADLTCDYGIKYVWRGRVTSMIGQDVPPSLGGIFTPCHPVASVKTAVKEMTKRALARCGHHKYAMHEPNRVLREERLRDGRPVYEFLRSDPYWGGVGEGATPSRLPEVMTKAFLDRLVEREATCVFYTHLGKVPDRRQIFPELTRQALCLLADYHRAGKILVTTTRRLLGYRRAVREIVARVTTDGDGTVVELSARPANQAQKQTLALSDLDGLTFRLSGARSIRVMWNGAEVEGIQADHPAGTDRANVALPWRRLSFPDL